MLDQWLASLSKTTIAIGAIVIGTLFIVMFNPPHTVCNIQETIFKKEVGRYFFIDPQEQAIRKRSRFVTYLDDCRFQNSSGGCFRFLRTLEKLRRELQAASLECSREIGQIVQIKAAIRDGMELMARLAWGESPPETYVARVGWFTPSDVVLFCRLKQLAEQVYGPTFWQTFSGKQFNVLPGAKDLPKDEAWSRMLASVSCSRYL